MVKFSNKESEKLYSELMEVHKDELRSNSNHVKLYKVDKKLGVNKVLFILAEYAVGNYLRFLNGKHRKEYVDTITNLNSTGKELSLLYKHIYLTTQKKIIEFALSSKESIEEVEIKEKPTLNLRDSVRELIETVGLLEVEKTLKDVLAEVEAEKSKHLDALYGTGK